MQVTVSSETVGQYQGDAVVVAVLQKAFALRPGRGSQRRPARPARATHRCRRDSRPGRRGHGAAHHRPSSLRPRRRHGVWAKRRSWTCSSCAARSAATVRQLRDKGCRRVGVALPHRGPPHAPLRQPRARYRGSRLCRPLPRRGVQDRSRPALRASMSFDALGSARKRTRASPAEQPKPLATPAKPPITPETSSTCRRTRSLPPASPTKPPRSPPKRG